MDNFKFQSGPEAARTRELIKNPRPVAARTTIKQGIMQAIVYPTTGAVLLKMDTGNSVALTYEEAMALRDLLVEQLPAKKDGDGDETRDE